jgi:hypothetical protein
MPRASTDWPKNTLPMVQDIERQTNTLRAIIRVLIIEGVDEQNYALIPMLLPKMRERSRAITLAGKQITRQIARRGRMPKWGDLALDIIALAGEIETITGLIRQNLPGNRYINIAFLLDRARQDAQKISEKLESLDYPPAIDVPEVFERAFEDDH